jgi:DNA-binding FadR family transcriptional regulator
VAAAAGSRLNALHHAVKPQAERYERLYVSFLTGEIVTSTKEHDFIVNAIQAGKPDEAEASVHSNWHNAAERLSQVIERVGERGRW